MSRPKLKRPAPGTVLGTLALIVALAGNTGAFAGTGTKITKADIAKGAVTANAIAPGAVRAKALAKNAVHSKALAAGAVNARTLASGAVSSALAEQRRRHLQGASQGSSRSRSPRPRRRHRLSPGSQLRLRRRLGPGDNVTAPRSPT